MKHIIRSILDRYESGEIKRRDLIGLLAALATAAPATAAPKTPFHGVGLNHLAVRVTDIPRARTFYQNLLGLPLISESSGSCFLGLGNEFLALFRNSNAGLDHFCIAIENFQPDAVMKQLTEMDLKPRRPNGTDRIYFRDPDGLEVQFSAVDHRA